MAKATTLIGGELVKDNHDQWYSVGKSTGRTAYLHKATVELDDATSEIVKYEVEEDKGEKFVNGIKWQDRSTYIVTEFANVEQYAATIKRNKEAYAAWKAEQRAKAEQQEAEAIERGAQFWEDERNCMDIVHRSDDGTFQVVMRWHAPSRYGVEGTWFINANIGKVRSFGSTYAANERSVQITAMHTDDSGLGNNFSTSAYMVGHSLEALADAIMQAVAR